MRGQSGAGEKTLIIGVGLQGAGTKPVLIRGLGPMLRSQGVATPLADPELRLFDANAALVGSNNDWSYADGIDELASRFGLWPLEKGSKDAAFLRQLDAPGYSVHVSGSNGGTGIAMAELYDADENTTRHITALSVRNHVGSGEAVLIAGFVISGDAPMTLLLRGLGPALHAQGVSSPLSDPALLVSQRASNGVLSKIAENNDWSGSSALVSAFRRAGLDIPDAASRDAALLLTVNPGVYMVQLCGVGDATGIGLIEAYDVTGPVEVSVARELPVRAASSSNGMSAWFALDKRQNTQWIATAVGQSVVFDLGKAYGVEAVDLSFADGVLRTSTFDLEASTPPTSGWLPVLSQATGGGVTNALKRYSFPRVEARFLRLTAHGSPGNASTHLSEAEILGVDLGTAPVMWNIAMVTDFSNRQLENLSGEPTAIQSIADLRAMLNRMENHWNSMSCGSHETQWIIRRTRLVQNLAPMVFNGNWVDFRETAARSLYPTVPVSQFDRDKDGSIDGVWLLLSTGLAEGPDYSALIGGASGHAQARIFVDGQASGSVKANAYGNFNHELAHCLEIPDLYGPFDNVGMFTLMSGSWYTARFSAYEKIKLGWMSPRVINTSTQSVMLHPAELTLEAVKLPTRSPNEYFLIEYRKSADDHFTTGGPYDGLVIYHVHEEKWPSPANREDKPLLRIVPADGNLPYEQAAKAINLWYPGNPQMKLPFVGRCDAEPSLAQFELSDLRWSADGSALVFDVRYPE